MYATSAKVRAHERRIGIDRNATPSNRKVKSGPGHLAGARNSKRNNQEAYQETRDREETSLTRESTHLLDLLTILRVSI